MDYIDPAIWEQPTVRRALADRDITTVYRLLVAAGVSQHSIARLTGQSQSEVSEILNGRRVKQYDTLVRVVEGLGVERGRAGLAYAGTRPGDRGSGELAEVTDDVKRRVFLAAAGAAAVGEPVLGEVLRLPAPAPAPLPSRLVVADAQALESLIPGLRALSRRFGGQAEVFEAVTARHSRLMGVSADDEVHARVGAALAELHTEAGWCCFDAGHHDRAQWHYRQALDLAAEKKVSDGYQVANTLRHAGIMSAEHGDPNEAVKYYQLGQLRLAGVRDDERVPVLSAWLHAQTATALARMDRPDLAREELSRARDGWQPAEPFDGAFMNLLSAWMHVHLGGIDLAEPFAAASIREWGSAERRGRAHATTVLATLHVQAREPDGARLAEQAVDGVSELRSARARARLRLLVEALEARRDSTCTDLARRARSVMSA